MSDNDPDNLPETTEREMTVEKVIPKIEVSDALTRSIRLNQLSPITIIDKIFRSVEHYCKTYGSQTPVLRLDILENPEKVPLHDIEEESDSGIIKYNIPAIVLVDRNKLLANFENVTLHSLTHATRRPAHVLKKDDQFRLNDSAKVVGYRGLGLDIVKPGPKKIPASFVGIDEGAAEAIAFSLKETYEVNNPVYFKWRVVTTWIVNNYSNYQHLSQLVQTNNVMGFVSLATGKKTTTTNDLQTVMDYYSALRNGADPQFVWGQIQRSRVQE